MRFLITGITGFAGPHMANLLHKEGHEIHGLIRNTNGMENDIRDVVKDEVYSNIDFKYSDLKNYRVLQKIFKENKEEIHKELGIKFVNFPREYHIIKYLVLFK